MTTPSPFLRQTLQAWLFRRSMELGPVPARFNNSTFNRLVDRILDFVPPVTQCGMCLRLRFDSTNGFRQILFEKLRQLKSGSWLPVGVVEKLPICVRCFDARWRMDDGHPMLHYHTGKRRLVYWSYGGWWKVFSPPE